MKSVLLPDEVYERAVELAEQDQVSVDKLVASLVHQHVDAWTKLRERAERGSLEKFQRVMAKVSDREPEAYDKL